MKRVVITGYGIYSCIGKNVEEVRDSLYKGKSGIIFNLERKQFGYRSGLTGFVSKPQLKGLLDRRSRIMLPEQGEFAYMATIEALKNARLDQNYLGVPTEPYALSNNVNVKWRRPTFEETKITFNKTEQTVPLQLKKWKDR